MKVLVINEFDQSKTVYRDTVPEVGEKMRFDPTSMLTTVKSSEPMNGLGELADIDHEYVVQL